jgi:CRP-like cAMP-binding protein
MVQAETAERFLTAPMWSDIDAESRRVLVEALVEDRAAAGTVLLVQGQPNDHLSFLVEGTALIERLRADGTTEGLATLHAPSVFGTTSFFSPGAPTYSVRAGTGVRLLTLYHPAHARLRREQPRAAEALAVVAVRVLSERFNELDRMFTEYIQGHPDAPPRVDEWAGFRARLFEELAD